MTPPDQPTPESWLYREMTVAHIVSQEVSAPVRVTFFQSARIYRLERNHPAFDRILDLLQASMATGRTVRVGFASMKSDVVEDVN